MLSQEDILKFLTENKDYIQKQFHITRLGLFGSFARGDAHENSDIDLLIELEDGVADIFELKLELKAFIENNLHVNVDICREKYLKPYVKDEVLSEALYV